MRSVAIMVDTFYKWGGGIDFISLVLKALDDPDLDIKVFIPKKQGPTLRNLIINAWSLIKNNDLKCLTDPIGIKNGAFVDTYQKDTDRSDFMEMLSQRPVQPEVVEYGNIADLTRKLREQRIDVMLPVFSCIGKNFPFPWIGYLFDMQHKYFPQNFPDSSKRFRDMEFGRMMRNSKFLLVGSRAVRDDLQKYYPDGDTHIFTLPFTPGKPSFDPSGDVSETLDKYGINGPYMIISNQFWAHKNHLTAFKAINELILEGVDNLDLVCTGSTDDGGSSNNFSKITGYLKDNNLEGRIKILGRIPKKDQVRLMYNSLALIQPTMFEGGPGGGAVFDAVTYGVPVIISDIPINHEVIADHIEFFPPEDHIYLAKLIRARMGGVPLRLPYGQLILSGEQRERELKIYFGAMLDQVIDEY